MYLLNGARFHFVVIIFQKYTQTIVSVIYLKKHTHNIEKSTAYIHSTNELHVIGSRL